VKLKGIEGICDGSHLDASPTGSTKEDGDDDIDVVFCVELGVMKFISGKRTVELEDGVK
jgi:hypothetical protein